MASHTPSRRAALINGATSPVGLAIAELLGDEGHALTLVSNDRERLDGARERLLARGHEVVAFPADVGVDEEVRAAVAAHGARYGRMDVLVNQATFDSAGAIGDFSTPGMDRHLAINLRSVMLFYRESLPLLVRAGEQHGNALVLNAASADGADGAGAMSVYAAARQGVLGFTEAMNRELHAQGIKSCALCPQPVDAGLASANGHGIPASDVAAMVGALLRLSPWCVIPALVFTQAGNGRPQ
jgi:3-oxoacyl-[acyl-carrier protein] reductase